VESFQGSDVRLVAVDAEQLKGCGLPEKHFHNVVATNVD